MKQLIYIYLIISFSAFSCTDAPERWDESGGKEISLDVSLYIPEFNTTLGRAVSDENAVRDMWLLTFDAQGLFLARLHATPGKTGESERVSLKLNSRKRHGSSTLSRIMMK